MSKISIEIRLWIRTGICIAPEFLWLCWHMVRIVGQILHSIMIRLMDIENFRLVLLLQNVTCVASYLVFQSIAIFCIFINLLRPEFPKFLNLISVREFFVISSVQYQCKSASFPKSTEEYVSYKILNQSLSLLLPISSILLHINILK